ncbi:hypothetical protein GGX14DRAFT_474953 [Mycena pura]|uniref:PH domain-containing protein n=1 Tax=Mycena pura TaxID=153505 RepID=A0AAD6UYY6_9AGAR|nr:hypothetical protein GGX14DRAFT_474953 [Mycena pura]
MVSGSEQGEVVDASGWEGGGRQQSGGGGGNWYGGGGGGGGGSRSRSVGRSGDEGYYGGGSGWGGGGDDGDDQRGRDGRKSSFSTPSSSDSEEDSDDSDSDDYGEPSADLAANSASVGARARDGGSDDDVPLARRIPSALVAQRTIRRKVREERNQRRREREELRALQATAGGQAGDGTRSRQTTLRPVGAGEAQSPLEVASSSREAARQAEASRLASIARARQRTQTLPGNGTQSAANMQSSQADRQHALAINTNAYDTVAEPSRHDHLKSSTPARVSASTSPPMRHQPLPEGAGRGLRAMRSFHRPKTADALHTHEPLPADAEARVRRSTTTRRPADDSRLREKEARAQTLPPLAREPPPSNPAPATAPVLSKLVKPPPPPDMRSARPSGEMQMRSSGEGLSTPPQTHRHIASKSQGTLTRVFIGDMQRFNMVDIGPTTSAKHILTMVEEQGSLKGWVGTGGWMVWEVAQDFGMERPIRSFELIEDIQASWNKDKTVNTFVLKLTPLAPILSRSNIPTSSPLYSGYVEWEYKRGKWTKRYLRLREHSLWLSKRDNGKDEICLCSLSNFDAYNVTRLHKAPKSFVFAVKSTDNLSFFENTADYLHIFSCNPKDGEKWVEKILLARSYVLFQERNVLFNPKSTGGNASGSAGPSRAAPARKASGPTPQRTAPQPLVSVDRNDVFAPGSLLSHGQ